jgi:RimJ/RimL family protein N-acetyltransferase
VTIVPITLTGRHVRLEPLRRGHTEALLSAATAPGARESFALTMVPADLAEMQAYVGLGVDLMSRGDALGFATIDVTRGVVVGSTRFANVERWAKVESIDAVEIGWTWLTPAAQRTAINTEAKMLMLGHAFERWSVRRVTLKTDARNARSRAAIERIGARADGVLRAHMPAADGGVRDSAMYSILAAEWPEVKRALTARLA